MPNRIVRESILDSDRYRDLASNDARLLFLELVLLADDFGLVPAGAGFLSRRTCSMHGKTAEAVASVMQQLSDHDLVRPYTNDGRAFAYIPRFGNSPRAKMPKWPMPPEPSRSEINKLLKKRIANATHLRAYAPETETETETEKIKTKHTRPIPSESGPDVAVIEKPKIAKPPPCPYDEIVAAYHELVPIGTRCIELSGTRREHMTARWRQVWADERFDRAGGLEFFRRFFAKVGASKFLNGQTPTQPGRRPFLVSLPWLMGPENFLKVIEGRYT